MFPGIESADQATQAIRHLRYPPDGDRGVATYNRAYGFGPHPERLETADERVLGIVQIKGKQAVERVEQITKVPASCHSSTRTALPASSASSISRTLAKRAFSSTRPLWGRSSGEWATMHRTSGASRALDTSASTAAVA